MYLKEILWFFSWPVFIWVSYLLVRYVLNKLEKKGAI